MKILCINLSPKGKYSTTVHSVRYAEKKFAGHDFTYLDAGQKIGVLRRDFSEAIEKIEKADALIFSYPIYTFIAPYQAHLFIELMKEHNLDLSAKLCSQITTSKHFYDVTAHEWLRLNLLDMGACYVRGLSADMDDLVKEEGRRDVVAFFSTFFKDGEEGNWEKGRREVPSIRRSYERHFGKAAIQKRNDRDVVIVTNASDEDESLVAMIEDFRAIFPYQTRVENIRKYPFKGGCLGCFGCAITGKCVYKDNFDEYLRNTIQNADSFIYAFRVENHYTHSSFKCFDDRQFCNGHRVVTKGKSIGYIIAGDYSKEANLRMIVEGRSEVGGLYLTHVATDEGDAFSELEKLSRMQSYAIEKQLRRPMNFFGVGGTKIFRDLIYVMRGLMKADHKYYRKTGVYDFPQKEKKRILLMQLVGLMLLNKNVQQKMKGRMNKYIIAPYEKAVQDAAKDGIEV